MANIDPETVPDNELLESLEKRVEELAETNTSLAEQLNNLIRGQRRATILAIIRFILGIALGAAGVPAFFGANEERDDEPKEVERWRGEAQKQVAADLEDMNDLPEGGAEVLQQAIIRTAEARLRQGAG